MAKKTKQKGKIKISPKAIMAKIMADLVAKRDEMAINLAKISDLLERYGKKEVESFKKEDWMMLVGFFEKLASDKQVEDYQRNKPNITFYG